MKVSINSLCEKYGSDKCPAIAHSYAPEYDKLFKYKKDCKKVLEIGAGSYSCMKNFKWDYKICSSLFVWRDYFKNAQIYGIDISEECLINEDRMTIFIGDQNSQEDMERFISEHGKDWDVIIDDGSHKTDHQIFSALFFMPFLSKDGIYCIEDIREPQKILDALKEYKCTLYEYDLNKNDCMIAIKK